jgi:hypothetical protein
METELIIILIAGFITSAGIYLIRKNQNLINIGIKTKAVVLSTRFERTHSVEDNPDTKKGVFYSTIEFTSKNGQKITQELGVGTNKEDVVGTEKKIIYDPQSPEKLEIDDFFIMVVFPRIVFGIGITGILWIALELVKVIDFVK